MVTQCGGKDTGSILGHGKDSHCIHICIYSCLSCNALPAKTTFFHPTPVAKSICKSNSVQRIVATCSFADISEVSTFEAFNLVKLKEVLWIR